MTCTGQRKHRKLAKAPRLKAADSKVTRPLLFALRLWRVGSLGQECHQAQDRAQLAEPHAVAIQELPEDEFYFFKAFRHGLFEWEKQVPTFLLQMAFVHAYTLFENYLRGILSLRLQAHPQQIGLKKQITYAEIFASASKEEIMDRIIDRELSQLMYEPIESLLAKMRETFGFRNLSDTHDDAIRRLALTRNCLMHNAGKVSDKLAKTDSALTEGQQIATQSKTISEAIHTYRTFCLAGCGKSRSERLAL